LQDGNRQRENIPDNIPEALEALPKEENQEVKELVDD
jgi:hypothetical protein